MRPAFLLLFFGLTGCSDAAPDGQMLQDDGLAMADTDVDPGAGGSFDADSRALEDDSAVPLSCRDGESTCINGKLARCDAKFGWLLEACPEGLLCDDGECVESACQPLSAQCLGNDVQICSPDGTGWSAPMPCPEGQVCQEGACLAPECEPGTKICVDNKVLECAEDGLSWTASACAEDEVCFEGQCIQCVKDSDCPEGELCQAGACQETPLEIVTSALPDGKENEPYQVALEAVGGTTPYSWSVVTGPLPAGLDLTEDGVIDGAPEESGTFQLLVEVVDDSETTAQKEYTFTIFAELVDLVITTGSPLPGGEEGEPYAQLLEATGGQTPYTWGMIDGALPAGLVLTSAGEIQGIPADHGLFEFSIKVFDNALPVGVGSKDFELEIKVAPLEIIGGQVYDLWITKVIVLPLITTVEMVPIPYSTDLEAKGGVKPYQWSEQPLPSFVNYLIPNGGIPEGLALDDDGTLHGSTTDTEGVVNVQIPFTGIDLSGYFFMARVEDSQDPADSDSAIYLIPTVPIAF